MQRCDSSTSARAKARCIVFSKTNFLSTIFGRGTVAPLVNAAEDGVKAGDDDAGNGGVAELESPRAGSGAETAAMSELEDACITVAPASF